MDLMRMRPVVPIIAAAAAALALWTCDGGRDRAEFTCVQGSDVFTLDPQRMSWQHDIMVGRSIYETLVANDADRGGLVPAAAERWECAGDGRTWTFTLRADGRWSNGDPVVAEDFRAAWLRAMLPDCGSDYAGFMLEVEGGRELAALRSRQLRDFAALPAAERTPERAAASWAESERAARELVRLDAPDDRTLRMTLRRRVPYWPELVAFPPMSPIHRPTFERFASFDLATGARRVDVEWTKPGNIVSNGPLALVEWRYRRSMRLAPNPHHRDAGSGIPRSVEIIPIEDPNTAVLAYEAGGVDWLADVRAPYRPELAARSMRYLERHRAEFDRLRASGRTWDEALAALPAPAAGESRDVHVVPSFGTDFYSFNCRPTLKGGRPNPFAHADVRRAFARSVDKRALAERVVRMGERVAGSLVPPGSIRGYEPPSGLGFDAAKAREELAAAGWADRDGDGMPEDASGAPFPAVEVLYSTASPRYRDLSLAMADMWRGALGVAVEVRGKDGKFFKEDLKTGNFTIARGSWYGDYGDPVTFLELSRTGDGNNDRGYSCPEFDALLDRAADEPDAARRMAILRDAERLLVERDLPILPLSHLVTMYMYDPCRVRGITRDASLDQRFQNIRLVEPVSP
jgi:oligopeptide transport system substrate-binding protein